MLEDRPELLQNAVANRWLHTLREGNDCPSWSMDASRSNGASRSGGGSSSDDLLLHWMDRTEDGIIYADTEGVVLQFNQRIACLTGSEPSAVIGQRLDLETLRFQSTESDDLSTDKMIERTLHGSAQVLTMQVDAAGRGTVPVEVELSCVRSSGHYTRGVLLVVRDLSDEQTLQQEIDTLHKKSVTDPLTKVANRAHFDDTLDSLIELAQSRKTSLSLVICDIDHFKKVNDVHGHQAGDEALVRFAAVLQSHAREGDLVARYGGEEFLLLAPSCDIATMTRRAEGIRAALEATPLPSLKNESVTASFGVTELQRGDSGETIVSRADRALLKAKDNGRNRVIQLGSGNQFETASQESRPSWLNWLSWGESAGKEFDILTPVPVDLAIEKVRGFISDHNADILMVNENQVTVTVSTKVQTNGRRRNDAHVRLRIAMTLSERAAASGSVGRAGGTNVHVQMEPVRNRDRRSQATVAAFRKATDSLRSYLMGTIAQTSGV